VRTVLRYTLVVPEYRRAFVPGGTFFFTLVTEGRAPVLTTALAGDCLRAAFRETLARWPFDVRGIVLLPDHLHTIWTLPDDETDFSIRWGFLKKQFTRAWLAAGGTERSTSASRARNRRRGVWQRRFWEHTIRDEADLVHHCDYIHYNPVKHGLVACPHAWPHSSFQRFVREKCYEADWQCVCRGQTPVSVRFDDLATTAME
jgi:putative transposase